MEGRMVGTARRDGEKEVLRKSQKTARGAASNCSARAKAQAGLRLSKKKSHGQVCGRGRG